ncbi:4-hydroxythreonine-4-phosphate dehydrogenase PdxA [bacterium]|nr:4-hydroxythreonine-4-phosphate dehydrogenase PdxA [bacterium]
MNKPLCALTMGDPAGIGPEVILKTLFSARANDCARMVVVGYPEPFVRDAGMLGLDITVRETGSPDDMSMDSNTVNVIVPGQKMSVPSGYGVVDSACGRAAGLCIVRSAELAKNGSVDAIVTAPINKEALNLGGYAFPGHTEFYQSLTGADDIAMLLTLGSLRVIHVVTHTAIRDVPDLIRRERIVRVAGLMYEALLLLGIERPRLAVCGLNPHAGEAGMFGQEEIGEIIPAVNDLIGQGIDAVGPIPPDTVFARAYSGQFDGVVAMYHDQGHIALKLAGFKLGSERREVGGVNTTLGLPIIRTSVDHGTAFDIAGKGIASPESMIDAVEMAARLSQGKKRRG